MPTSSDFTAVHSAVLEISLWPDTHVQAHDFSIVFTCYEFEQETHDSVSLCEGA